MISSFQALELEVVGEVPAALEVAAFQRKESLWVKGEPACQPFCDQHPKRYQYSKVGKVLGLQTTRFLALQGNVLYYFDDLNSSEILGYCTLSNTYLQWLPLVQDRYLLVISNGTECSHFYFSSDSFWKEQRSLLAHNAILLNFHQDYEVLEELGQGSFAKVYRVRCTRTGEEFAAKMVSKASANCATIAMLAEEKRVLACLQDSCYIYQFREFHQTNEEYILLMEYLPGVDLMSFLRMQLDLSVADRKYLLTNILMGLKDCHESGVIHRDIKPQNIIVDVHTYQMKLIDFGLSLQAEKGSKVCRNKCGTVGYMAPEVFQRSYSEKSDIFSFGIIAHLLLMGSNPLKGKSYEETCLRSQAGKINLKQADIVDQHGQNALIFLRKCLSPCVEERYSAEQALMSSYLRQNSGKESVTTDDDRLMRGSFE